MTIPKQFKTASAHRRDNPLVWQVDTATLGVVTVRLDPFVSMDDYLTFHELVSAKAEPQLRTDGLPETPYQMGRRRRRELMDAMARFVVDEDRNAWLALDPELDRSTFGDMQTELLEVYGGGNPTERSSSADPPPPSGGSSTDGAPAVA